MGTIPRKVKRLKVTSEIRGDLEQGYKEGKFHCFPPALPFRQSGNAYYELKVKELSLLEQRSEKGTIDLYYDTVVVLDNARVHQNKKVRAIQHIWAKRRSFIFFLSSYCPHLNIISGGRRN